MDEQPLSVVTELIQNGVPLLGCWDSSTQSAYLTL